MRATAAQSDVLEKTAERMTPLVARHLMREIEIVPEVHKAQQLSGRTGGGQRATIVDRLAGAPDAVSRADKVDAAHRRRDLAQGQVLERVAEVLIKALGEARRVVSLSEPVVSDVDDVLRSLNVGSQRCDGNGRRPGRELWSDRAGKRNRAAGVGDRGRPEPAEAVA